MIRRGPAPSGGEYKEVRGLSRGVALLRALNRMSGGTGSITGLAHESGLHRTTVKRLLETLRAERLVEHDESSGRYVLTFEVRRLSEGYGTAGWIDRIAVPAMFDALPALLWPSDISTPEAGFMVVRESTHRGSALSQHRAMIGTRLPMPVTAAGRAYLAWCGDDERAATLALLASRDDPIGALARDRRAMRQLVASTLRRGWAVNEGEWLPQADFAAIALPVRAGGRVVAAINLVFPKSAVSRGELARRYVPPLRELVESIGARLERGRGTQGTHGPSVTHGSDGTPEANG